MNKKNKQNGTFTYKDYIIYNFSFDFLATDYLFDSSE